MEGGTMKKITAIQTSILRSQGECRVTINSDEINPLRFPAVADRKLARRYRRVVQTRVRIHEVVGVNRNCIKECKKQRNCLEEHTKQVVGVNRKCV